MPNKINRVKLFITLSLIWCAGVIAFSFKHLEYDYKSSIRVTQEMSAARIELDWQDCIQKLSPNPWPKLIDECRATAERRCIDSVFFEYERCLETEYKSCSRSIVPECSHIFINAQEAHFANPKPAWKRNLEQLTNFIGYSDWLWYALALLVVGPLCFWLLPRFVQRLHKWFYR